MIISINTICGLTEFRSPRCQRYLLLFYHHLGLLISILYYSHGFFHRKQVFQLGIKGAVPNENNHPGPVPGPVPVYAPERVERPMPPATSGRQYDFARGQYIDPPSSATQEEEDLQKAIARSIEDSRNHLVTKGKEAPPPVQVTAPKQPDLLIDFFSDPIPAPQPVQQ